MNLFFKLHPFLILILSDMYTWCDDKNIEFVITDTISTLAEDKKLNRVSSTHRTARAVDLRVRNWSRHEKKDFLNLFNKKYAKFAAVDTQNNPNLIVMHDSGSGFHAHIQIHSKYKIENPFK